MERFKVVGILAVALGLVLGAQVTPAAAVAPTIDGILSGGEWDGFFVQAFDPNELGIADAYDIAEVRAINDAGGLYVLLTTYGAPTLADQDAGASSNTAFLELVFDYDGNGLFTDAGDRRLLHSADTAGTTQAMTWKNGSGTLLLTGVEGTNFKLASVYEYFVPSEALPSTIKGFAFLDNGGADADDRLPDVGTFTPVPEPASMSLMGLGLLGLFGGAARRRRA